MRWHTALALLALAACSPGKQPQPAKTEAASAAEAPALAAAPKTKAEALLYKYTRAWPGHPAASGPYAPRDDCAGLAGAEDFRLALAKAVAKRDPEALIKLADPNVRLDFGGEAAGDLLRKRLDSPIYRLWDQLAAIVPLGCASQARDSLTIPWYFAQDIGDREPFAAWVTIGGKVPLLDAPGGDPAKAKKLLSWELVEAVQGAREPTGYLQVKTSDGQTGYVARKDMRALTDYRLLANKTAGGWLVTGLIAGD